MQSKTKEKRYLPGHNALSLSKAAIASVFAIGVAHAEIATVEFISPISPKPLYDRLEIKSDGTQYIGAADGVGRIDTEINLNLSANIVGRVKSWKVWIQSTTVDSLTTGWSNLPEKLQESYPFGSRPKNVEGSFGLPVSFSSQGATYCNLLAHSLRGQGYSNAEIFSVDRQLSLTLRPALNYEMIGISNVPNPVVEVAQPGLGDLTVICQAYTPDPVVSDEGPERDPIASIAYANLALAFDDQPTECPTEVMAQALFTSSTIGRFSVRLRDAYGHTSQTIELRMQAADKMGSHYVKTIQQSFLVGDTDSQGGRPPIDADTEGFLAEEQEPPPVAPEGLTGIEASDQLADLPRDPNEHVNSVWIEIVEAGLGSVTETDHEEYRIYCQNSLSPDLRGPSAVFKGIQQSVEPAGIRGARAMVRTN